MVCFSAHHPVEDQLTYFGNSILTIALETTENDGPSFQHPTSSPVIGSFYFMFLLLKFNYKKQNQIFLRKSCFSWETWFTFFKTVFVSPLQLRLGTQELWSSGNQKKIWPFSSQISFLEIQPPENFLWLNIFIFNLKWIKPLTDYLEIQPEEKVLVVESLWKWSEIDSTGSQFLRHLRDRKLWNSSYANRVFVWLILPPPHQSPQAEGGCK